MTDIAIECQGLTKSYGGKQVLKDVSLRLSSGDFFGLVGMNGSGKTTLIKTILDLTGCDAGSVSIFGKAHREVSAREHIAYLPDRFSPPAYLRCRDFLGYMLAMHNADYDESLIKEMFVELDLNTEILNTSVMNLSKGMTQKLGLISCLLSGKKMLILDEPMSGLDPRARVLFKRQLRKLKEQGASLFFSSHVLTDVEEIADTMSVLHYGEVLYSGTHTGFTETYKGRDLEQAYMNCLSQKIPTAVS